MPRSQLEINFSIKLEFILWEKCFIYACTGCVLGYKSSYRKRHLHLIAFQELFEGADNLSTLYAL
jgi:hypothetical protein